MGKHERGWVEATEKLAAKMARNEELPDNLLQEGKPDLAENLVSKLQEDFPEMTALKHAGNSYDSLGDLILIQNSEEIYIEAKFVSGWTGTLANPGQDLLTQLDLFEEAKDWSQFREDIGFNDERKELLQRFDDYPDDVRDWKYKSAVYDRAGHLKNVINVGRGTASIEAEEVLEDPESTEKERKAARIIKQITEADRAEKLEYMDHLRSKEQNQEAIEKFTYLMLCGYHTQSKLEEQFSKDLEEIKQFLRDDSYRVYAFNKSNGEVRGRNPSKLIEALETDNIRVKIPQNQSSLRIVAGEEPKELLKISYNWKNKFQGIQTPSMNLFKTDYIKEAEKQLKG